MAASTASSSPKTSNASCCANDPLKYAGTIMRIKLILPVALLFLICSIHSPAQDSIPGPSQQKKEQTPSIRKISTVTVACLVDKLTSIGGAPPEYVAGKYKVQALLWEILRTRTNKRNTHPRLWSTWCKRNTLRKLFRKGRGEAFNLYWRVGNIQRRTRKACPRRPSRRTGNTRVVYPSHENAPEEDRIRNYQ